MGTLPFVWFYKHILYAIEFMIKLNCVKVNSHLTQGMTLQQNDESENDKMLQVAYFERFFPKGSSPL